MAIAAGTFGTQVTADARLAVPCPASLTLEESPTIPVAFLTAWYALRKIARLERGQRVLIDAASGGVGQAAIQLARQAGAEIRDGKPRQMGCFASGVGRGAGVRFPVAGICRADS